MYYHNRQVVSAVTLPIKVAQHQTTHQIFQNWQKDDTVLTEVEERFLYYHNRQVVSAVTLPIMVTQHQTVQTYENKERGSYECTD